MQAAFAVVSELQILRRSMERRRYILALLDCVLAKLM
jgi:hypothetical protein